MQDRVAEVLRQRERLDRGVSGGIAVSLLLHAGLIAAAVYAAMNAPPMQQISPVSIQFARMPGARAAAPAASAAEPRPAVVEKKPEPKITEPQPKPFEEKVVEPAKVEKNSVPFSPFGRSTKKGSDAPAPPEPKPAPSSGAGTADASVPVGGSGVTGLEGGDFPYSLYLEGMQRRISGNWYRPQTAAGAVTVIYFRILRDGSLTDARVETPSGNATFDRAALSAVRSSSPLTPLPFGYNGTYLGVHLTFK